MYLTLFVIVFLIKFLKRYLLSGFIANNYKSRVLIDPRDKFKQPSGVQLVALE